MLHTGRPVHRSPPAASLDAAAPHDPSGPPSTKRHHPPLSCAVCLDELHDSTSAATATYVCGVCGASVCHDCMLQYVHMTIAETGRSRRRRAMRLTCPGVRCPAMLSPDTVVPYTSHDDYQVYVDLVDAAATPIECPRCEGRDVTVAGRKLTCATCHVSSCNHCGDPYHLFGCRQDKAFQRWKQHNDVRTCPQCHAAIEKTGGCTHMTCIYCAFDFCWLCRVEWQDHADVMCKPRAFLTSTSTSLGPTAPVRAVTKAVVVVAALAVVAVGVGVATVLVAPPLLFANSAKTWWRRQKQGKSLKALKQRRDLKLDATE
ncbi:hypothetical protein H310_02686 [Aphanomyces invadans]|uniref:RBR-type E3 ubiquitin transferase n=1 Tax=Aphanomyces invadans TaxID=157072 RepID=A0A024UJI1_9STRA|nr:hypothetical protein H310_02686 [Aphanomyces invadans]ETW06429.1 hypothetical protein H310_02686 [Aphanomyces invadans]|eukprot:XP_008864504.1 hypothetical protein H310_02686 [Aphanomyces invadans]